MSYARNLTQTIGYAEHFVVHHTHQIYSLGLMRAKAVGSMNRSETDPDGVKMINSMITEKVQYSSLGNNYSGIAQSFPVIVNEISYLNI
jgi:hypothetical protein